MSTPRLASRPTPAGPSTAPLRPVATRPTLPRPTAPRPAVPRVAPVLAKPSTAPSPRPSTAQNVAPSASVSASAPASASTAAPGPGAKDTSSSAGKVFAKPSKEWVLPERAKPGRKVSVEEPDSNRLSQRAHRARRTDYIATLEERIRQFENDEIHSNVRLQEVARALKADNERLKGELSQLQLQLQAASARHPRMGSPAPKGWEEERAMLLEEVRALRGEVADLRARYTMTGTTSNRLPPPSHTHTHTHTIDTFDIRSVTGTPVPVPHPTGRTPTAMINGSDVTDNRARQRSVNLELSCPICPNPDPDCPCQSTSASLSHPHTHTHPHVQSHNSFRPDPTIPLGSAVLTSINESTTHSCGFCSSTDECLCRAVQVEEEEEDVKPDILTPPTATMRLEESCGLCADGGFCACAVARGGASPSTTTTTSSGRVQAAWGVSSAFTTTATSGIYEPTGANSSAMVKNDSITGVSSSLKMSNTAVPLRRLRVAGIEASPVSGTAKPKSSIWSLDSGVATASTPIAPLTPAEAQCTGDPRNCDACKNDTFGKEFCENFFTEDVQTPSRPAHQRAHTADNPPAKVKVDYWRSSTRPHGTDPLNHDHDHDHNHNLNHNHDQIPDDDGMDMDLQDQPGPLLMSCCGDAGLCNHQMGGCAGEVIGIGGLIPGLEGKEAEMEKETIRVDQAWKALKAHPNAKFASLAFLADIVAQRVSSASSRAGTPLSSGPTTGMAHGYGHGHGREDGDGNGNRPSPKRAYTTPDHTTRSNARSHPQPHPYPHSNPATAGYGHPHKPSGLSESVSALDIRSAGPSHAGAMPISGSGSISGSGPGQGHGPGSSSGSALGKRKMVETSALRDALHVLDEVEVGMRVGVGAGASNTGLMLDDENYSAKRVKVDRP